MPTPRPQTGFRPRNTPIGGVVFLVVLAVVLAAAVVSYLTHAEYTHQLGEKNRDGIQDDTLTSKLHANYDFLFGSLTALAAVVGVGLAAGYLKGRAGRRGSGSATGAAAYAVVGGLPAWLILLHLSGAEAVPERLFPAFAVALAGMVGVLGVVGYYVWPRKEAVGLLAVTAGFGGAVAVSLFVEVGWSRGAGSGRIGLNTSEYAAAVAALWLAAAAAGFAAGQVLRDKRRHGTGPGHRPTSLPSKTPRGTAPPPARPRP